MSKKTIKPLVPKLRFSEFRDKEAWDRKTLGDITYKTDKKNKEGKSYPVYSINNIVGFVPQAEQFEGVDSNKRGYDISLYKVIEKNTFAYNPARINVGSIGYSGDLNNIIVSSLYVCFKTTQDIDDKFFLYFIETPAFTESVEDNAEGGIRNYLFYENFSRIKISLPRKEEQQKIADCLSSIDEVIAAQTQKVEVLKSHKKGLMQQLFPAEGETVPERRFPEFRGAGEWKGQIIGNVCKTFSGGTPLTTQKKFYGGKIPFIRSAEIDKDCTELCLTNEGLKNSAAKLVEIGDVLVALYGANSGEVSLAKIDGAINQAVLCLKSEACNPFIYQFLSLRKDWIVSTYVQGGQGNLSGEIIKSVQLRFPLPEEQQKIGDCLSSIDELITAEAQKVEVLKAHKKGLMQQLFPSIAKVNG